MTMTSLNITWSSNNYRVNPVLRVFSLPVQLNPFPVKPVLQIQTNEPTVLQQMALTSQTGTEALHSSASEI